MTALVDTPHFRSAVTALALLVHLCAGLARSAAYVRLAVALQQTEGEGRQHHGGQRQWK